MFAVVLEDGVLRTLGEAGLHRPGLQLGVGVRQPQLQEALGLAHARGQLP